MKILVIGSEANQMECIQKFGDTHSYQLKSNEGDATTLFNEMDVIFYFSGHHLQWLSSFTGVVFVNSTTVTLSGLLKTVPDFKAKIFGFCGLPGFLNRDILEISLNRKSDQKALQEICNALNTEFALVADQVGMVTPRIICMIINEAYYTVVEGTALRQDIDLAMKLGTNYPFGPFEWAQRIGLRNVVELLRAVHEATADERYTICDLLQQEASSFSPT